MSCRILIYIHSKSGRTFGQKGPFNAGFRILTGFWSHCPLPSTQFHIRHIRCAGPVLLPLRGATAMLYCSVHCCVPLIRCIYHSVSLLHSLHPSAKLPKHTPCKMPVPYSWQSYTTTSDALHQCKRCSAPLLHSLPCATATSTTLCLCHIHSLLHPGTHCCMVRYCFFRCGPP